MPIHTAPRISDREIIESLTELKEGLIATLRKLAETDERIAAILRSYSLL